MATLAGTVGKVMMKLSHNRALAAGGTGKKAGKTGLLFYAGLMLNVVVNPVGYALAYNFASQSLIVPLSALVILANDLAVVIVKAHIDNVILVLYHHTT